ncbi:MAG TPA: patatin-like phospholipase family protein [Bacillus sp. (in: firmicutes)]|uniref:patatin-like phospholipase family protein n=1 Tax=Bacillus litorisediminis TaxID=2922713 RepID=UPI001FAF30AA|nr:patatin-like phospholipase family protein [Bacillus litorisediminis]HWO77607.1 patatin-like phospholipase family protein [Bacillus sp. (in: firmicutes)]
MYIDGVFSGGGIKGFALVGAYEAIEERGLKFKRLAATSAGSIVAGLIAAGYSSKEVYSFVDELDVKKLLDERTLWLPIPFAKWLLLYWRMGLYRGQYLEKWLGEKLAAKGIRTFKDLPPDSFRVIASDLTNGNMMVLPNDLEKYGIPWWSFSVAKAIRMSCSIPYFFEPVRLSTANGTVIVVDGGVLSNFPMWLFDKENVKKERPVLGIKLSSDFQEHEKHVITNAIHLFGALFETMKDAHDSRYISRKHEKNIIFIPTQNVIPIEFDLTEEKKEALIRQGKEKAATFLKQWCY